MTRKLPYAEALQKRFGPLSNLIYVKSDDEGRVVAHFTMYNIVSWQIILAETGGTPSLRTGLVSNPPDPATWSDAIASELDVVFAWFIVPTTILVHARERLIAAVKHYYDTETPIELKRILDEVFAINGLTDDEQPITDPELLNKTVFEASKQLAAYALGLPHEEKLTGVEVAQRMRRTHQTRALSFRRRSP